MTQKEVSVSEIFEVLQKERPRFHGREQAGSKNYAIQPPVLEWMIKNIPQGAYTFETGCGYSSVILASLSKKHTVISPFSEEHELIRAWCTDHGIPTQHVNFITSPSQDVVPNLTLDELDFILIDGDHAFPAPFIDWYYTADRLRVGGFVAVDDTQIPTGKILRDFLIKESDRWNLASEIGKTAIFVRSKKSAVAKGVMWGQQPYCKIPKRALVKRIIQKTRRIFR